MVRRHPYFAPSLFKTDLTRTLQEGFLSRRLLVFTDHQASFYCSASSWMEGLGALEASAAAKLDWTRVPTVSLFDMDKHHRKGPLDDWYYFTNMVRLYSSRNLTKESDALNAFLGVVHYIRQTRPAIHALCGLPFLIPPDHTAGTPREWSGDDSGRYIENVVCAALSWYLYKPEHNGPYKRRSMFPSWTWVGWQGTIYFPFRSGIEINQRIFLRRVQLESSPGEVVELPTSWEAGDREEIQRALDTVTGIQFEAPMILADCISITGYQPVEEDHEGSTDQDADFRMFRVCGRSLARWENPGADVLNDLIKNVRKGIWSCLVLHTRKLSWTIDSFVLVVQWEEDQVTAERIGALIIYKYISTKGDDYNEEHESNEEEDEFSKEDKLSKEGDESSEEKADYSEENDDEFEALIQGFERRRVRLI